MQNHNFSCWLARCHIHTCEALVTPSVTARYVRIYRHETQGNYAFPAFTMAKKNTEEIRFVTDCKELNKYAQRSPFLVPPIRDTLNRIEGFKFAITIDISMDYWHIKLDLESQDKRIITTPWGRYAYARLPMGLSSSADIFQERMSCLVEGIEKVICEYFSDILNLFF